MASALKSCCLCCLLAAAAGCGKAPATPDAILEKAIAAHGGEAKVTKRRVGRARGVDTGPDTRITWEEVFEAPGRWIKRSEGTLSGRPFRQALLFTDGRLWKSADGGQPEEVTTGGSDPHGQLFGQVALLLRLRQPPVKLSPLPEVNIGGREAVGVKAESERSGSYYFDKESGLLQKMTGDWASPRAGNAVVALHYGDYREVDGVKLPHRITISFNGERTGETVVSGVELLGKLDERVFELR